MDTAAPPALTRDFYDRLNDRRQVLGGAAIFIGLNVLLIAVIANPGYFIASHDSVFLLIAWLLLAIFSLAAPRLILNLMQGFRGIPALRFDDRGIWSRRWSQLGWIAWDDIAAVVVGSRRRGKLNLRELRVELRRREYALLPWNDQFSQGLAWLLGCVLGLRAAPQALPLISTTSLTGSWDELIVALDPVLSRNGVCKREENDR